MNTMNLVPKPGTASMSEEEKRRKLKSIRGAYKGHCSRDIAKAKAMMELEIPDTNELEALQARLERRTVEISQMDHTILMSLDDEKAIEKETEEALDFNDEICGWKSVILS